MAVSSTSVKGFIPRKSLDGADGNASDQSYIIENSATVTLGDAVRVDSNGYLKRCSAGDPVLGILVGIVDQNGQNIFSPRAQGTTGATLTPDDTVAVSSTNTSDGTRNIKGQVLLDPSGEGFYFNSTNGTVAVSNLFQYYDISSNAGQIDTATASNVSGQFQLVAVDPDGDGNTAKGLFRIAECQLTSNVNSYNSGSVRIA